MKKLTLFMGLILFGSLTFAAESKFGVVDMQKAILATKQGKTAQATMKKDIEDRQKKMEKMRKDFEAMQKDFQKKSIAWSDDLKGKKMNELQQEGGRIQEFMFKNQQELQRKELSLKKPIIDKLKKSIDAVAKRGKYTMIFEGAEDKVLYVSSSNDITEEVVKEFEKLSKKK